MIPYGGAAQRWHEAAIDAQEEVERLRHGWTNCADTLNKIAWAQLRQYEENERLRQALADVLHVYDDPEDRMTYDEWSLALFKAIERAKLALEAKPSPSGQ